MRVYNLSKQPIDYRGHVIQANGGSAEYPELNQYLPARDKRLEEQKILAFGFLPSWWLMENGLQVSPEMAQDSLKEGESLQVESQLAPSSESGAFSQQKNGGKKKFVR